MKIALINGSPKAQNGASSFLLEQLRTHLDHENKITMYHLKNPVLALDEMESLIEHTVWVLAFPLYVDAIPSHLLNCLVQLEEFLTSRQDKDITVYVLANCGFYEGRQNEVALEIMQNWCAKSELNWGQGVGFGSGGMLLMLDRLPFGQVTYSSLEKTLKTLKDNLQASHSDKEIYLDASIPRFVYKLGIEIGWRRSITANGRPIRDLSLQR